MVTMDKIQWLFPELEENYQYLHQHPELGFEEQITSAFIAQKLDEYGIPYRRVARTGIIADIAGEYPGRTVAIRADMDALPIQEQCDLSYASKCPGKMHACGHDAHVAMLLSAARYFGGLCGQFRGKIRLLFQPAEEGASMETLAAVAAEGGSAKGGAASMIACGALEGVDACFALHVNSMYPTGTFYIPRDRFSASSDIFELTIQGKGGHGSSPENAVDPMGALAAVIAAYNALPAREISALDSCSLSIGAVKSGEAWNVIPDSAYLTGGLRTFSNELRDKVFRRLKEIAEGICAAHRCTATFLRHEGYAPGINTPELAEEMLAQARKVFGEGNAVLLEKPMMGSEDAGYYFQEVPGAMGWLGSMPDDGPVANHSPLFQISLKSLRYGVLLHINMALDYLERTEEVNDSSF